MAYKRLNISKPRFKELEEFLNILAYEIPLHNWILKEEKIEEKIISFKYTSNKGNYSLRTNAFLGDIMIFSITMEDLNQDPNIYYESWDLNYFFKGQPKNLITYHFDSLSDQIKALKYWNLITSNTNKKINTILLSLIK